MPEAILQWGLGAGESSVIALALSLTGGFASATAVLDDLQARRCARAAGLSVVGTLGVVVRAARQRRLPKARPTIRALRAAGLYLDDRVIRTVLQRVLAEDWVP